MSYMDVLILVIQLISWIVSTRFFVRCLCVLFWYHLPNSLLPPLCRSSRFKRNELLKSAYWGYTLRIYKRLVGPFLEVMLFLTFYWACVSVLSLLVLISVFVFNRYLTNVPGALSIVAFSVGVFSGFVFAWAIHVLEIFVNTFSLREKSISIATIISVAGLSIEIFGPENIRRAFGAILPRVLGDTSLGELGTALSVETLMQLFGNLVGIMVMLNILLSIFVGYKTVQIRKEILPK